MKQLPQAFSIVASTRPKVALLVLVILSPIVFTSPVLAEKRSVATWSRTYAQIIGGDSLDATPDGGFAVTSTSFGAWVMKADTSGRPQWENSYTPAGYLDAEGGLVEQTRDGGYLIAGGAIRLGGGDPWLFKLDNNGNVQWSRIYDGEGFSWVKQTSDGGYIIAGRAIGPDPSDGWILKLNAEGNIVWQEMFRDQDIYSVDQTRDGGYVVAGTVGVDNKAEAWVFKLDVSGSIVWARAFEAAVRTEAYSVQQTHDGGYVVAGEAVALTTYGSLESSSALLLRLDSKGNLLWEKSFGGSGFSRPSSIVETFDRGFVITGSSRPASSGTGIRGPWLLKLDAKGNLVWQKVYGGANDHLLQVQETRDKGFIAAGALATYCCGYQAWVLKLDSEGNIGDCPVGAAYNATLTDAIATMATPTVTSVTTNATSNEVSVMVTNNSSSTQTQCIGTRDGDKEQHHDEAPD